MSLSVLVYFDDLMCKSRECAALMRSCGCAVCCLDCREYFQMSGERVASINVDTTQMLVNAVGAWLDTVQVGGWEGGGSC